MQKAKAGLWGPLIFSAITDGTQTQHWRGGGLGRSLISLTFLFTFKSDFIARRVAIFTPGTHALAHPTSVQLLLDGLSRFWRAFPSGEARPERRCKLKLPLADDISASVGILVTV